MESSMAFVNLAVSSSVSFFSSDVRSISMGLPINKFCGIPFSLTTNMGKMGAPVFREKMAGPGGVKAVWPKNRTGSPPRLFCSSAIR